MTEQKLTGDVFFRHICLLQRAGCDPSLSRLTMLFLNSHPFSLIYPGILKLFEHPYREGVRDDRVDRQGTPNRLCVRLSDL